MDPLRSKPSQFRKENLNEKIAQGFRLFVTLLFFTTSIAVAQEKIRTIQDRPLIENSPITVVSRELGDKTFDTRNRVVGDRDWLSHLTLSVKNVSNKNIVYFNIDLIIPKQGEMPGTIGLFIYYGNRMAPGWVASGDSNIKEKVIRPGDVMKVKVSDDEFLYWDKVLKKYGVEDIERVTLDIRTVHFDDGTGWQLGIPLRQDPNNPKTWWPLAESKSMKPMLSSRWIAMLVPIPLMSSVWPICGVFIPARGRNFSIPPSLCSLHRSVAIGVATTTGITHAMVARTQMMILGVSVCRLM
jgi:hypothetical protein